MILEAKITVFLGVLEAALANLDFVNQVFRLLEPWFGKLTTGYGTKTQRKINIKYVVTS